MSEPALRIDQQQVEAVRQELYANPPRLNERVFIYKAKYLNDAFTQVCATIRKCGLVAEVVQEDGKELALYAARRRNRNKHD